VDPRERLSATQAQLVSALVDGGTAPPGFDAQRVAVAASALVRKRARLVRHAWPSLAASLGEAFDERFAAVAATPPPREGGGIADGFALADALAADGVLSGEARVERLLLRAGWRRTRGGAVPRRGAFAGCAVAGPPRRLVLAVRVPGLGTRLLTLGGG